jgi:uncharacterized protein
MPKVVLDTVVLVRGLINPRSICGRIVFDHQSQYRLFVCQPIVLEFVEVLQRPELTRKFRSLPGRDIARVMDIVSQAEAVAVPIVPAVSRDPKDDKFLATALAAQADYLVTEDQDLLVLQGHHGTQIVHAAAFLQSLQSDRCEW